MKKLKLKMGKSLTHKIQKDQKAKQTHKEARSEAIKQDLMKAKKTAGSIKKTHKKEVDQKKKELDELKQMLNLEPPKIDLDSFMKMGADGQKLKKKKMSTKQRRFKKLLQERNLNMQLDKNPKTLIDKQVESIT